MQVTIDSSEPLDDVLAVIGALYGVRLTVERSRASRRPALVGKQASPLPTQRAESAGRRGKRPDKPTVAPRSPRRSAKSRPDPAIVRGWAKANGHEVRDRGRIPLSIASAYLAAGAPGA